MAHTPLFFLSRFFEVQWLEADARIWLCGFERNTVWYNAHKCYGIQVLQYVAAVARTI